jgi:hypothetical protein
MYAMVKTWNKWGMDMPPSYMGLSYHGYILKAINGLVTITFYGKIIPALEL